EECRTVVNFLVQVNGQEKAYDLNGRSLIHTAEYRQALQKLENKIEELKEAPTEPQSNYSYSLPLAVELQGECGMGNKTIYTVQSDGTFIYDTNKNLGFEDEQPENKVSKNLSTE